MKKNICENTNDINYVFNNIKDISKLVCRNNEDINDKASIDSPTFTGNVVLLSTTTIGNVSSTELGYINGLTSNVQNQFNDLLEVSPISKTVFGKEYLYAFIKKMRDGSTPIMVLAGDSKTRGDAITNTDYLFQNLYKKIILQNYHSISLYNDAVSGSNTKQWINTYLSSQIARNPDLLLINYGFNDGANNRLDFEEDLDNALTQIRSTRSVNQTSILLLPPISGNDSLNGRDAEWFSQINPILRKLARKHLCVFIDVYSSFLDSENGEAWYDNPYGDGRHIHQKEELNLQIASLVCDVILPKGLNSVIGSTSFENNLGVNNTIISTDNTSIFPKGLSFYRTNSSLPFDGAVFTMRQVDGVWLQFNGAYTNDGLAYRTGRTSGWNNWNYPITTLSKTQPLISLTGLNGTSHISFDDAISLSTNRNPWTGSFTNTSKTASVITLSSGLSSSDIQFYAGNTPNSLGAGDVKMVIKSDGKIGFNTNNPFENLHYVSNSTNVNLRIDGNAGVTFLTQTGSAAIFSVNRNPSTGNYTSNLNTAGSIVITQSPTTSDILFYAGNTPNSLGSQDQIMTIKGSNRSIGINQPSPNLSAALDITSTTQGFLLLRMTAAQASAIVSLAEGLMVYVTDTNGTFTSKGWYGFNGATWDKLNN